MIKVIDDDNEYSLTGESLMVVDLENPKDYCQVDQREFSEFEASVYKFLVEMKS
jgi:hypothetical protein